MPLYEDIIDAVIVDDTVAAEIVDQTLAVEVCPAEPLAVDLGDDGIGAQVVEENIKVEIETAQIISVGGVFNWIYEEYALTASQITTGSIFLGNTPYDPESVQLWVEGGAPLVYGEHFIVTGSTLSWSGLDIDGILAENDVVGVRYVIR